MNTPAHLLISIWNVWKETHQSPQQRESGNEGVGGVETSLYPLHNLGMLNHTEALLSQETLIFKIFIKVIDAHV